MDRVKLIQQQLVTAQSKQKSYSNRHVRDVSFSIGEWVFLKVLLGKGVIRFVKKAKFNPRFI